ncbi:MAG: efflux RND transporter periplasmic adaptor subunit [Spirochaetaceae bacterium]|jgi:RND family efflux transporter MFP subunit|nr:efflux RND transporter periplasmic adaptor subunit [Spirochaetaceae bacterium]
MKNYIIFFVCAFIIFFYNSCSKNNEKDESRKIVQGEAVKIKEVKNELSGFGVLSYKKKVDVAAPQDAVIKKLLYREGQKVTKDKPIAILENSQIILSLKRAENNFSQSQAELSLARAKLLESELQAEAEILSIEKAEEELSESWKQYREEERKIAAQEQLFKVEGISEETIRTARFNMEIRMASLRLSEKELDIRRIGFRDKDLKAAGIAVPQSKQAKIKAFVKLATARARAEVEGAAARRDAAEKELASAKLTESELTIRCPFSGVIAARYLEEGERVKREDAIFTIIDTESLCAMISVPEADAFRLETGMNAVVELDGLLSSYNGIIDLISPVADNKSFTFSVRVVLSKQDIIKENGNDALSIDEEKFAKPGMFARVSINLGPPYSILALKDSAIINKTNKTGTVFIVNGEIISERTVTLGELTGDEWEITEGLREGEVAVIRPASDIQDGEYVLLAE